MVHEAWQLEGSAAEIYERHLVPAITSLWAADLVERAAPRAGERVLDQSEVKWHVQVVRRTSAKASR